MELKARGLHVNADGPFDGDLLGREAEIKNLTELLRNVETPLVLAVNGRWGAGKTTFVNMWSAYLRQQGFRTLNFNAWTTDFSEDPLVAFLGEMNKQLDQYLSESGARNETWEKCKRLGGEIARRGFPIAIKLATAGIIDENSLAGDTVVSAAGGAAEDAVKAYESTRTKIDAFKKLLSQVLTQVTNELPLVVFVDELDRCRPTYAIELLERIKHLFDLEGVVFVLSMDKAQLCHSIGAVYGNIDAESYLRRFIDLEFMLPAPSPDQYISHLIESLGVLRYFKQNDSVHDPIDAAEEVKGTMSWLCYVHNFSLREIGQLLARISLALRATPDNQLPCPGLIVLLIVFYEKDLELYSALRAGGARLADAIKLVTQSPVNKLDSGHLLSKARVEGYLRSCKAGSPEFKTAFARYDEALASGSFKTPEKFKYDQAVYFTMHAWGIKKNGVPLPELIRQVELIHQFSFSNGSEES